MFGRYGADFNAPIDNELYEPILLIRLPPPERCDLFSLHDYDASFSIRMSLGINYNTTGRVYGI